MTDVSNTNEPSHGEHPAKRGWSRTRLAVGASVVFHIVLAAVLLGWYFPKQQTDEKGAVADAGTNAVTETQVANDPASSTIDGQLRDAKPDAMQQLPPADNIPREQIDASLRSAVESTKSISDERKLSELERNLQRLEQVASEQSIEGVGEAIRSAAGLQDRASVPAAETVDGQFDFDSAQFHDVSREMDKNGNWVYRSILLDAKGRTFQVDLTESEGKTAYETMQMVKASPFAETVYRSMVMPMLDKMIPKTAPMSGSPSASIPAPTESTEPEVTP